MYEILPYFVREPERREPLQHKDKWGFTLKELLDWAEEQGIDPANMTITAESGYVLPEFEIY